MTHKLNTDKTVAVSLDYDWQPISTCPMGVKVQLFGRGGVAHYGIYRSNDTFYIGWAPLPKIPKEWK